MKYTLSGIRHDWILNIVCLSLSGSSSKVPSPTHPNVETASLLDKATTLGVSVKDYKQGMRGLERRIDVFWHCLRILFFDLVVWGWAAFQFTAGHRHGLP